MSANSDAVLLTDEQIQQFICDGYIALESDVDPAVHQLIDERLQYVKENEFHMGNNFMPRIPEFHLVTDCPVVRGALISILGADYMLYSHRCIHWRDPEKEPVSDELFNERVRGDSHQDSYPPFLNWRSHPHQFVRMMYYPHDTELVNGPTHVVPGSHYHGGVSEEDRHNEIPITGKAGTVFLSHFDIIHSGSPNQSDRVRNMMKFIFARGRRADHPSWDHVDATWKNLNTKAPY
ncbi:MAG: phytanoyl-CoA dioxygenase family protein, partial [Lentisphaeria bacterium]|nr:phytanoyl-CoA dioxygenase family protein [Lentisphaeria bacterium]NQZ70007.1 phytanoyl-CoA dioxygenase family protein [Lentisphaeria bacterium]